MGRKTVAKSPEEAAAQKAKWAADRNTRRAAAYQTDPSYRESVVARSRQQYRKKHDVDGVDCRTNLNRLGNIGTIREIELGGGRVSATTFDVKELAEALGGYNANLMYRWQRNGQLPLAVVNVADTNGLKKVYVLEEVTAIINVLGSHQTQVRNYRRDHSTTVDAIFVAVESVRRQLNLG